MSLTESYIVPDFYYTESGIPTLYNSNTCNFKTTTLTSNPTSTDHMVISSNRNLNSDLKTRTRSFIPLLIQTSQSSSSPSTSSSSTSSLLFKSSSISSTKSHNNYSNSSTSLTATKTIPIKCCKTPTTKTEIATKSTIETFIKLESSKNNYNNINCVSNQIYCDKNHQNLKNKTFKFEIPKKLLTKRGTIYQNEPQLTKTTTTKTPRSVTTATTPKIVVVEVTTNITTGKNIPKKYNEIDSNNITVNLSNNSNNNSNNDYNFRNSSEIFEMLKQTNIDKECKTYLNNKIKELQNRGEQIRENYQNQLQQQQQRYRQLSLTTDQLNCSKYVTATNFNKTVQQNNFRTEKNAIKHKLDNRITFDYGHQKSENFSKSYLNGINNEIQMKNCTSNNHWKEKIQKKRDTSWNWNHNTNNYCSGFNLNIQTDLSDNAVNDDDDENNNYVNTNYSINRSDKQYNSATDQNDHIADDYQNEGDEYDDLNDF